MNSAVDRFFEEEDELILILKQRGHSWVEISDCISGRDCRERYRTHISEKEKVGLDGQRGSAPVSVWYTNKAPKLGLHQQMVRGPHCFGVQIEVVGSIDVFAGRECETLDRERDPAAAGDPWRLQ